MKALESALAEIAAKGMVVLPGKTKEQKMNEAVDRINKHDEEWRLKMKERAIRDSGVVGDMSASIDKFYETGNKVD